MSAFLGPIHKKMYARILYQDKISDQIISLAKENGWDDNIADNNSIASAAINKPLEEIIDPKNIHGWLSNAVENCETRYANLIFHVLFQNPDRIESLLELMNSLGVEQKLSANTTASDAFHVIHDVLLDGMPCDFPFKIEEEDTIVNWQVTSCPHSAYWADERVDTEVYYQLRDAWIGGILKDTALIHTRDGNNHQIRSEI